ncbi:MAG: MMPL family transporter, partial [Vulcanimicrobiaceae bacterium]
MNDEPMHADANGFDRSSGSWLERALFNHRRAVLALCVLVTLLLGFEATHTRLNARYEDTIPTKQPYIQNFLARADDLTGLGNSVRIVVETTRGSIYSKHYLDTLKEVSDDVFLVPGVDRNFMKSLWTPTVRWVAVTEDGLAGGPVVPEEYDGSPRSVAAVRTNVERAGLRGQLVAKDLRSSLLYVPLLSADPATGKPLDYAQLSAALEQIRDHYQRGDIRIHITGFAEIVGDLIASLRAMLLYFTIAVAIAAIVLYAYTRDVRSTLLVVSCSLVAVLWQLGATAALGFALNPYSILVPFLVFAIGMSHGAQKMNGIMQDVGRGAHRLVAARATFRRLFVPGITALVCDAVSFAVLSIIQIRAIQELALVASIGVAILIVTNLILLPILLSYVGVDPAAAQRSLRGETRNGSQRRHVLWQVLCRFTERRYATAAVAAAVVLAIGGSLVAAHLRIGDLGPGAPELRASSVYNRDNAYLTEHYGASSDLFAVLITTPPGACAAYDTLEREDALAWQLRQLGGVDSTDSLAGLYRTMIVAYDEGSPKWYELLDNQSMANMIAVQAPRGLHDQACDLLTLYVYLKDHEADTLTSVIDSVSTFAAANDTRDVKFTMAAGNAGIEAATNIVVKQADRQMLLWIYAAVIVLCLITFRSWRAVLCAVLPLALTSVLAEALMVGLHIGVKVSTLPVIALGVGIGVDYSLYVISVLLARLRDGMTLDEAYHQTLRFTGRVVLLTGGTLAVGVATWAFSPIKYQADMGILLCFMFLWNMLGALILVPALAHFLLPSAQRAQA